MTEKKIVKLAVIRDEEIPCPYGLPISEACRKVGSIVDSMTVVNYSEDDRSAPNLTEEDKRMRLKTNRELFLWRSPGESCKYLGKVFKKDDEYKKVHCLWTEGMPGLEMGGSLVGSPYYYRHFSGIGLDGLYSIPLSYYVDNSIDRGHYYGCYSIESIACKKIK